MCVYLGWWVEFRGVVVPARRKSSNIMESESVTEVDGLLGCGVDHSSCRCETVVEVAHAVTAPRRW